MALPQVLWVALQFVIVVFPDHTHILVGWYFFYLDQILIASSGDPDWMAQFAGSNLGLHGLHMPHKKDSILI